MFVWPRRKACWPRPAKRTSLALRKLSGLAPGNRRGLSIYPPTKYSRIFRQTRQKKRIWMRGWARSRNCLLKSWSAAGISFPKLLALTDRPRVVRLLGPSASRPASCLRMENADFATTFASGTLLVLDSRRALSGALGTIATLGPLRRGLSRPNLPRHRPRSGKGDWLRARSM